MSQKRILIITIFLGINVLVSSVAGQQPAGCLASAAPQELDELVPDLMSKAHIPGMSIALIREGEIVWTGAFGVRSVATGVPCDDETVFEAASLTKPLFAYLALLCAAEGKLDLDRPLITYLPEQINFTPLLGHPVDRQGFRRDWLERITARHVLSHSSGLPHGDPIDSVYPIFFEPGSQFRYSADGYYFLQLVLELLEGMPLEQIAQQRVLGPLGMATSCLVWRDEYEQIAANGHNLFGDPQDFRRRSRALAGATLYSTATDYARFVCAVLNNTLLSAAETEAMLTPQIKVNEDQSWSMGFGLQQDENGTAFWQWGDYGIFRSFVIAYKEPRCGVVWLTNSSRGLSITDSLVTNCLGGTTYISEYPGYDSYDSPFERFVSLVMEQGAKTALGRIAEFRADDHSVLNQGELNSLGYELLNANRIEDALAFFEFNCQEHPKSSNAWDSFAEGQFKAGRLNKAIESYRRVLKLDSTNTNARRYIEWIGIILAAHDHPPKLSHENLSKFVGTYGPRRIRLQNDTLYYYREGSQNPERHLYPLKRNLFGIQDSPDWRLRFEVDDHGQAIAVEGLHVTGTVDRHERGE